MSSASLYPTPSLSPFDQDIAGINAFLDDLTLMRAYCLANDVFISRNLDAQQPAKDIIKDLLKAANTAPVFSEGKLKLIPWSEVSAVGNGTVYTAPTSTGPIFDLTVDHFIVKSAGDPPVKVVRPRLFDVPNVVAVQFVNHNQEYNDGTATAFDNGLIAQYGPIRAEPEKNDWIHNAVLAQQVAQLLLWAGDPTSASGGGTIARRRYQFRLPLHLSLFDPMDLVTITDLTQGIYRHPVRLLSLKEQEDGTVEVEAEDFIYGSHALPGPPIVAAVVPIVNPSNQLPGAVNAPFFFEPTPALDPAADTGVDIWIAVSGANPEYGGCHVWLSTDGGASYGPSPIGMVTGSAVMGFSLNDLPSQTDPDIIDSLQVNLAESRGILSSVTAAQADLLATLFYLSGGGTATINGVAVTVPYELLAYQTATLAASFQYILGTRLRRNADGSPNADHPVGSKFALLNSRIFKLDLPFSYLGQMLWFKFTAFNTRGQQEQNLAQAVPYSYTPVGWPATGSGGGFYVNGA